MRKRMIAILAALAMVLGFTISLPAKPVAAVEPGCLAAEYQAMLDTNWAYNKTRLAAQLQTGLANGNSYVLYTTQVYTNNLLVMAEKCNDRQVINDLAELYLIARDYMYNTDANGVPYPDGHYEWHCTTSACVNWATHPFKENTIVSSQFVYLLAKTLSIIAHIPAGERTSTMSLFVSRYLTPISKYHMLRWVRDSVQFDSDWSGCGTLPGTNHQTHLTRIRDRQYGATPTYCNAVRDQDLWIHAAAIELLDADVVDSTTITLSATLVGILRTYIGIGYDTLDWSHFAISRQATGWDGRVINVIGPDPGAWRSHPDWAYAGDETSTTPPTVKKLGPTDIGWDISHARRLVHWTNTSYNKKSLTGAAFPSSSFMTGMAYQIAYVSFEGDFASCKVNNYWGGANGWYRVGYNGASGTPPYGLTKSVLTGGFAFWTPYDPGTASKRFFATAVNRALADPTGWGMTETPATSLDWLQTLPSLVHINPADAVA